ncbi:MAG: AAA family ATPase, partial [Deltaproteobacteria bacterium]|nr:AAA family ATPase [Deltaproteobacteria bacterium]
MLGTKINNRYHLEQELFATARGTLYLATDDSTGEMLAVKIIPGASLESGTGLRYAHLLKRLEGADHPNLLLPLETGAAPGGVYQVLPYYPGQSLEEVLNQGPLPPEEALLVLQQVAQALGRLHGKGVYHHGVRPANILLSREEGVIQAVLTDPGRSLLYGADTDGPQEAMYRAPEQTPWLESAADGRADFYALGMIAYPLLAGRLPFTGTDARSIHHQHLGSSPPDLRNLNSGLPPRIAEIVARLTARQPRERPPNAFAVLSELESWARPAGGSSAGQGAPGEPAAYIGGFMSPGRALVGRQTARQAIQAALDDASAGRGTMVVLNGPAGMGRRRLLEEMASSWESARALVLRGDSTMGAFNPPYALPLSLLESLVRRWAHIGASRREELADRLRAGVGNDGVVLKSILPALGPMVSSLGEQPPVPMERQRHRYMNLLCSVLLAPGEKGAPVVLWLNGASGADADSVDWLRLLAHRMKNRPALVVVDHSPPLPATGGESLAVPGDDQETDGPAAHGQTAASGGAGSAGRFQRWLDSMPRGDQVRWVELPGLNESQTRLMISDCLGLPWEAGSRPGGAGVTETGLSGQLAAWLGGAHGGHPLALETGLRILAARGWLRRAAPDEPGPPWRFDQEQARSAPWPDSLRALLNLRVELLPRDVLQTLQAAAVLHSTFTVERLQPLLEQHPPLLLLELLECAVEEGLLARGGGGFRFAHPLLHQAVLGTVTGAQRQRLHILAARTMDRGGPVPPLRMHHQTALHFLAAGDNDSLLDQGLTAARAAGSVQALHALAFWMDALGPLLSNDPRRLPLLLAGSTAQAMLGRYERAGRILDSLDSADLEPGDELEVLRLSAWVARRSGRPAEALELVKEALERGGEPLPRSAAGGVLA